MFGRLAIPVQRDGRILRDAVPRIDIPRLIDLWRAGKFPIERMMKSYPLSDINAAEADAASGTTIKPVLIPGEAA